MIVWRKILPLLKRSRRLLVPPPSLCLSALLNVAIDSFICLICISASLSWQCAFCWKRKPVQKKERKLNVKKRKIPNNVIQKCKHIYLILKTRSRAMRCFAQLYVDWHCEQQQRWHDINRFNQLQQIPTNKPTERHQLLQQQL